MLSCKIPGWFHKNKDDRPDLRQMLIAISGSFLGIGLTSFLTLKYNIALLVPSLGASAVLLYAASHVPMAKPKNVFVGHIISAIVGVAVYQFWGLSWWSLSLGVTLAIAAMMLTDTLHPPGGATAFAAIFSKQNFSFVLEPVAIGVLILVIVAFILHNITGHRKYPWW